MVSSESDTINSSEIDYLVFPDGASINFTNRKGIPIKLTTYNKVGDSGNSHIRWEKFLSQSPNLARLRQTF